jgi:transcriptional regulator with XRE-family HTH domain
MIPVPNERIRDRYPSRMREFRERALMTRLEFFHASQRLAEQDPSRYKAVTTETLRNLEGGFTKPRLSTARTISAVLGVPAEVIFPGGFDSGARH